MIGDEDREFYNIELIIQDVVVFNINVWIYQQVVFAVHISDASKVPVWGNDLGSYIVKLSDIWPKFTAITKHF